MFFAIRLGDVKNMGITVSLDDFGTGFSSFARMRDLNIDIVKIDKQFIDNISVKKESNLISEDIISMVHKVGLEVVAEGVETDIQMQYLKKHDCDIIQGYLVSRPLAEDRAIEFLESKSAKQRLMRFLHQRRNRFLLPLKAATGPRPPLGGRGGEGAVCARVNPS